MSSASENKALTFKGACARICARQRETDVRQQHLLTLDFLPLALLHILVQYDVWLSWEDSAILPQLSEEEMVIVPSSSIGDVVSSFIRLNDELGLALLSHYTNWNDYKAPPDNLVLDDLCLIESENTATSFKISTQWQHTCLRGKPVFKRHNAIRCLSIDKEDIHWVFNGGHIIITQAQTLFSCVKGESYARLPCGKLWCLNLETLQISLTEPLILTTSCQVKENTQIREIPLDKPTPSTVIGTILPPSKENTKLYAVDTYSDTEALLIWGSGHVELIDTLSLQKTLLWRTKEDRGSFYYYRIYADWLIVLWRHRLDVWHRPSRRYVSYMSNWCSVCVLTEDILVILAGIPGNKNLLQEKSEIGYISAASSELEYVIVSSSLREVCDPIPWDATHVLLKSQWYIIGILNVFTGDIKNLKIGTNFAIPLAPGCVALKSYTDNNSENYPYEESSSINNGVSFSLLIQA